MYIMTRKTILVSIKLSGCNLFSKGSLYFVWLHFVVQSRCEQAALFINWNSVIKLVNSPLNVFKDSFCLSIPQILGLMVVRKMLDMVFSQHDLAWVDDILPDKEKKKKDEDKKNTKKDKKKGKAGDVGEEEVSVLVAWKLKDRHPSWECRLD